MRPSALLLFVPLAWTLACGDKDDSDSGASDGTDGTDGASDGADGTTDGTDGATDGTDGASDGTDGGSDGSDGSDGTSGGAPTPIADVNTIVVDGIVFPLIENGYDPCASDSYFHFSAAFGDTSLYYSLTAQYITSEDPPSGRHGASDLLWNLRGSDASWGTPDDTEDVYLDNQGGGVYELIWNDMSTNYYGDPAFVTSGWVRCEL